MLEHASFWSEYGGAPDPRDLPEYEYRAHMAVLEGISEKRKEEQRETERQTTKARQQAG